VGGISIAEGWLPASVNDAKRASLADIANILLDLGGGVTTTGSGGTYAISLPSAPTAYADNLLFVAKLNHNAPGASTINVNSLGVKDFKQVIDGVASPLTVGDGPAGHRAICFYSSADNAVLMLNAATAGVIYESNGEDLTSEIYDPDLLLPPPGGAYEWYNNNNFAVLRGSLAVLDEEPGRTAPYKGDYNGWMPLFMARNYATTADPSPSAYQHPQDSEGTPKLYGRGGLVLREENDSIDLVGDRLNFDGAGNITTPPNPVDAAPVLRAYSRMAGVDHFNVAAAGGSARTITSINTVTGEILVSSVHGLIVNDRVVIQSVGGTTQINTSGEGYQSNGYVVRTIPSSTKITLKNLAGTATSMAGWGVWTSGGTVTKAAAHYGISHPMAGDDIDGRFALYQQRYVPAADYSTTGRYSGHHEFQATAPASNTVLPATLLTAARIKAPLLVSGNTPLVIAVTNGSSFDERDIKTKAVGDLDPSDRVLYIDQAEAGTGRMIPYSQTLNDSTGRTLTTSHNGYTIYSSVNPTRITFQAPASYPEGLRYRFVSGGAGGVRFVVGSGTIRQGGTTGTQVSNPVPTDGDSIVVESVSTAIFYVVSMVGAWTVS
jgi:hypothetical protein